LHIDLDLGRTDAGQLRDNHIPVFDFEHIHWRRPGPRFKLHIRLAKVQNANGSLL
jgi:hypothetical protein